MDKRSKQMNKSKNVEKHETEEYGPVKKSLSVLSGKKDVAEVLMGFEKVSTYEKNVRGSSGFKITSRSKTYSVKNNLKAPIVLEADSSPSDEELNDFESNSNKSNFDFTPDSSENDIRRSGSEVSSAFERSNVLSGLQLDDVKDFENMEFDVGSPKPESQNLGMQNKKSPLFYCLKNKVLVIMKPETTFWFCGKLKVQVLYGSIKIYGASLSTSETTEPVEVYSPRNYSLVGIETESDPSKCDEDKLWQALVAEGVNREVESSLVLAINHCQTGWAVVLLENLTNHLTTFLNAYCSFKLFPKLEDQTFYSWNDLKRAEATLQANFRFSKIGKQLTVNPEWRTKVIDRILNDYSSKQQSINLIFGGKSVGKSTFSRYLINSILPKSSTVVFINLDPGQTECTPAGCISLNLIDKALLGPSFTQLRKPYYQLYIGDVNVANCVTRYLEGVKKLADRLRSDSKISSLPVIVNTMGFCKGIGWDIAVSIIRFFQPTNVVQIVSKKPKNNFEKCLNKDNIAEQNFSWIIRDEFDEKRNKLSYALIQINSEAEVHGTGETWNMEPYQKRDLVMLAYLSQITDNNQKIRTFNYTTPRINDAVPYKVPLSSLYLSLTQTGVPLTHVLAAMNGNIVALCGYDACDNSANLFTDSKSENPQVLVRTPLSTCYGFGVIRGVDIDQKFIYVNASLSLQELRFVNCLVDCVPIPTALLPLNLPNAPYTGNKVDLPTSKEPRRGYFRMRNQTALQT